jgi:uncharacterized protein YqhQ
LAVAVRRKRGDIVVDKQPVKSLANRYKFLKMPFMRGVLALIEALVMGIKALTYSASQAVEEEEEELTSKEIFFTVLIAFGFAILLFVIIPTGAAHFLKWLSPVWQNVVEGILRIAIFFGYIIAISRMKDIQRVFEYHGAEHKVIHAYEAGEELKVENCRKYTTLHPRCGTAFLFFVLVLTIIFFSFLNTPNLWWRILSRVLLMPIIAGASYEIIKLSGKYSNKKGINILIKPGLWLQKLTTREPDDRQLEVSIKALNAVLKEEK